MKIKWHKAVLSLACAASLLFGAVGAKAEVIHEKDLEDYILSQMASAQVSGMSISIVNSEKELYCAAYGAAQKTTKDYILGDLSKSFTAAAIMRLAEDSELRLEDPVGDYLPEYQKISDVTIEDLLHHTSGIAEYEVMSDIQAKGKKGSFEYANANYNLLGKIIEAVTNTSYIEYVSDNILDPLDMESTYSLGNTAGFEGEMVTGYQNYFGFPFSHANEYDTKEDWMQIPSNYLISDVKDMGNYLRMYLQGGGDVLSEESVKSMLYQGVSVGDDQDIKKEIVNGDAKYAMGWIEKEVSGQTILYHTGSVENYSAAMILLPEEDLGISLLFNGADVLAGQGLIEQMEAGILAIEVEQKAEAVDSRLFYVKHVAADLAMVIVLLGAWIPIFLMGFWIKRRRNDLWNPIGIGIDVAVHLVLPTVLLAVLWQTVPVMWVRRFLPSVYYVALAAIISLYIGAAIKVIAMVLYGIRGPKEDEEETGETEIAGDGAEVISEEKSDKKEAESAEPENKEKAEKGKSAGLESGKSDQKEEKKPGESEKKEKAEEEKKDEKEKKSAGPESGKSDQKEEKKPGESEKKEKAEEGKKDEKEKKSAELESGKANQKEEKKPGELEKKEKAEEGKKDEKEKKSAELESGKADQKEEKKPGESEKKDEKK